MADDDAAAGEIAQPSGLFDEPPPFATGAESATVEAATSVPVAGPVETAVVEEPFLTDDGLVGTDDPLSGEIELAAQDDDDDGDDGNDGDDPDLLEQVADAVGNLWDDVTDVVT